MQTDRIQGIIVAEEPKRHKGLGLVKYLRSFTARKPRGGEVEYTHRLNRSEADDIAQRLKKS